jgi:hypothetical protein
VLAEVSSASVSLARVVGASTAKLRETDTNGLSCLSFTLNYEVDNYCFIMYNVMD